MLRCVSGCCRAMGVWCVVLQCFAVCCSVSMSAVCCSVLQCNAVLQCDTVCCSVMQCATEYCSVLRVCRSALQHVVAACYGVLQCVAV